MCSSSMLSPSQPSNRNKSESHRLESMQVVADEVLSKVSDLVADTTKSKLLGEGLSLGCTGRRNGRLDEAMLISPSADDSKGTEAEKV